MLRKRMFSHVRGPERCWKQLAAASGSSWMEAGSGRPSGVVLIGAVSLLVSKLIAWLLRYAIRTFSFLGWTPGRAWPSRKRREIAWSDPCVGRRAKRQLHRRAGTRSSRRSAQPLAACPPRQTRSEEHTSELQSLMRHSYAVFCLHKKNNHILEPI